MGGNPRGWKWEESVQRVMAGESRIDGQGYRMLYLPMHPSPAVRWYAYEHRIIAERMIGRLLSPGEKVHHKNGDRLDNRPGNLEVMAGQFEHAHEHLALAGRMSDDEVRVLLLKGYTYDELRPMGISAWRITRLRKELGVPPYHRIDSWAAQR